MKNLLKVEELAMFAISILFYQQLSWAWYWYLVWFFVPDIGMLGYLINTKIGAIAYNLFHHKGLAILVGFVGYVLVNPYLMFTGIVLFGHASFDRVAGYGLKYFENFNHTHLGIIGKQTS